MSFSRLLTLSLFLGATSASSACHPAVRHNKTAITNVRVFDGIKLSGPTTVTIDNGQIESITDADGAATIDGLNGVLNDGSIGSETDSEGAASIDGLNGVLIPGLIDCHVHVLGEEDLRTMAAWGVTTGLGMGDWPAEMVRGLRGRSGMADFLSAGVPATSLNSTHSQLLPLPAEEAVNNPGEAAGFIDRRIAEGVDYIKIVADVPGPDQDTLNALVSAAHDKGKLVIAHAATYEPFAMAQKSKADIVTHSPADIPLDNEAVSKMLAEGRISVPTLVMSEAQSNQSKFSVFKRALTQPSMFLAMLKVRNSKNVPTTYENARDSVAALHRAGVPVLAGSDANSEPNSPAEVP